MLFIIFVIFSLFVFPVLWLNYILNKNNKTLINMPFNGLEFGNQILKENGFKICIVSPELQGHNHSICVDLKNYIQQNKILFSKDPKL